jgi:hypothetical protein
MLKNNIHQIFAESRARLLDSRFYNGTARRIDEYKRLCYTKT